MNILRHKFGFCAHDRQTLAAVLLPLANSSHKFGDSVLNGGGLGGVGGLVRIEEALSWLEAGGSGLVGKSATIPYNNASETHTSTVLPILAMAEEDKVQE